MLKDVTTLSLSASAAATHAMLAHVRQSLIKRVRPSMSRRNLDTIYEAIRHLEGSAGDSPLRRGAGVKRIRISDMRHDGGVSDMFLEQCSSAGGEGLGCCAGDEQPAVSLSEEDITATPAVAAFELVVGEHCGVDEMIGVTVGKFEAEEQPDTDDSELPVFIPLHCLQPPPYRGEAL